MAAGGSVAMAANPWRVLLASAMASNSHLKHSSYLQLATISYNGRPANRTVVFRGFQEGSDNILIHTDRRTNKIEEVKHCPYSEICWYFTETWEQFRIKGRIEIIDCSTKDNAKLQQREKSWFSSSLMSRLKYLGPTPNAPALSEETNKDYQLDPSMGPVDSFCILVFEPQQIIDRATPSGVIRVPSGAFEGAQVKELLLFEHSLMVLNLPNRTDNIVS